MTSIIRNVKSDFDKVIQYSQSIPSTNTDEILKRWYNAKKDVIDAWDGQLIVETSDVVIFELSEEEQQKRLDAFIEIVENIYENEDLSRFLSTCRKDFFKNHLSESYIYYPGFEVPKGTKVIKAFKYFEDSEKALKDLQNQASMIIQENKICGKLCFSVHPLDYLSSSENTYKWRSCHALDGDYRAGNLSYMLDTTTIICYLKTDNNLHKLPNFPDDVLWNSKKWRMLLFLDECRDALFAGRQYPFFSRFALSEVSKFFCKAFKRDSCFWSEWHNDFMMEVPRENEHNQRDKMLKGRHVALGGRVYPLDELVIDNPDPLHFNDLIWSTCYTPYYSWYYFPYNGRKHLRFPVGSSVPCVCCGKNDINMEASMLCLDCAAELGDGEDDYFTYCACCERRVPRVRTRWIQGIEDYLCEDCYKDSTRECERCGDRWYNCEVVFDHETNQYLCPTCLEYQKTKNLIIKPPFEY